MATPASDERPLWRKGFDTVEGAVGPRLSEVMASEPFQVAVGIATTARKAVQTRAERAMRRAWHMWNLPAGSDVTRILNELGRLQREVRELRSRLEGVANGASGRSSGSARPRTARR